MTVEHIVCWKIKGAISTYTNRCCIKQTANIADQLTYNRIELRYFKRVNVETHAHDNRYVHALTVHTMQFMTQL